MFLEILTMGFFGISHLENSTRMWHCSSNSWAGWILDASTIAKGPSISWLLDIGSTRPETDSLPLKKKIVGRFTYLLGFCLCSGATLVSEFQGMYLFSFFCSGRDELLQKIVYKPTACNGWYSDTWEQPAPAEPAIHQEWATPKNTQNYTRHRIL